MFIDKIESIVVKREISNYDRKRSAAEENRQLAGKGYVLSLKVDNTNALGITYFVVALYTKTRRMFDAKHQREAAIFRFT